MAIPVSTASELPTPTRRSPATASGGSRLLRLVAFVLSLIAATPVAAQIQVREVIWGFNGTVRGHRFSPVSLLVDNASSEPFEDTLQLLKSVGGRVVDAPLEQRVYMSPFTRKWVQFYPFVKRDWERWTLVWDSGRERFELPQPPFPSAAESQLPAVVLLSDSQDLTQAGGAVKRFPDALFPPVVTATDSLDVVLLDYVPRWTEAQRQSFLDWLSRGGTVHLLLASDGEFPRFPPSLAALNTPADQFPVGSGIVFRQRRPRGEVTRDFMENVVLRETASSVRRPRSELDEIEDAVARPDLYGAGDQIWVDDFSAGVFHDLRSKTIPRHKWPLIYILSLAYIFLLVPCSYVLGRRRVHYLTVYGVILGTIGLFSVALALVGRRGHNESTSVHTVAIARHLPRGHWDVTAWSNAFVRQGDVYRIDHQGTGGLYSTGQEAEPVRGAIHGGTRGYLQVDVPPYSSRTFVHRVKTKHDELSFRLESVEADRDRLQALVVSVADGLPKTNAIHAYAVFGNGIYPLKFQDQHLELAQGGWSLSSFLNTMDREDFWHYANPNVWGEDRPLEAELYPRMVVPLIAQALSVENRREAEAFRLPPDRLRVFVYAPLPPEFHVRDKRLQPQDGSVLYSFDLFVGK